MSECDINTPVSCTLQNGYEVVSFGDLFFYLQIDVSEFFMLKVNPEYHSLESKYILNREEQKYDASSFKSLIEPLLIEAVKYNETSQVRKSYGISYDKLKLMYIYLSYKEKGLENRLRYFNITNTKNFVCSLRDNNCNKLKSHDGLQKAFSSENEIICYCECGDIDDLFRLFSHAICFNAKKGNNGRFKLIFYDPSNCLTNTGIINTDNKLRINFCPLTFQIGDHCSFLSIYYMLTSRDHDVSNIENFTEKHRDFFLQYMPPK